MKAVTEETGGWSCEETRYITLVTACPAGDGVVSTC